MYVYLKLEKKLKCVSGVTLHDGYCPMVGDIGQDFQLEPAIWFKTLIIDSILIDCNSRLIRWGRANVTESSVHSNFSGKFVDKSFISEADNIVNLNQLDLQCTVFEDGDCYDFEPTADELFDSACRCFQNFDGEVISEAEFKTEILRLLHCFVLPFIQLTRDDVHLLQDALQFTEKRLQTLENDVLAKDKGIILTENSLKRQRDRLINNERFDKESYVKTCNPEFLRMFLNHVNKDIDQYADKLEDQQKIVDALRNSVNEEEKRTLSHTREERDKTHDLLQKLQLVRENIKNVIVRTRPKNKKSRRVKQGQNVFHDIYFELSNRLQQEKDAIHKLCLRKVKISSVREAVFLTLDQLKSEKSTFGWEANIVGTDSATNILRDLGIPESWKSLEEQVSQLIANPEVLAHVKFKTFCETIHQKIQGSLQEAEMFLSSPNRVSPRDVFTDSLHESESSDEFVDVSFVDALNAMTVSSEPHGKTVRTLSETSIRRISTTSEVNTQPFRSLLDILKKEIAEHFQEMCQILYNFMPEYAQLHGNAIYNKIWVCYEKHLYHNIMDVIEEMYGRVYNRISASIRTKLDHLSFGELGIDEGWLLGIEGQSHANDYNQHEESTQVKQPIEEEDDFEHVAERDFEGSATMISLDKLSMGQLYECADKDCDNLAEFLSCSVAVDALGCEIDGSRGTTHPKEIEVARETTISNGYDTGNGALGCETTSEIDDSRGPPSYNQACAKSESPPPYSLELRYGNELHARGFQYGPNEILYLNEPQLEIPLIIKPFEPVLEYVSGSLKCKTVLCKLKQITKAFRFMGKQVSVLKNNPACSGKDGYMACCDDILTVTIVVLKFLDVDTFQKFYAQMNLIIDLMPPFMAGSVHDCSLTNFCCAFQYLMDREVIRQSREIT